MAIAPINNSRVSPPVDGVGDKQLERQRREFLDLIKSDERRHSGDSRRGNREQQSHGQQSAALEAGRQALAAAERGRSRPAPLPAGTTLPQNPRPPGVANPGATASNPAVRPAEAEASPSAGRAGRTLDMSPTARAMLQGQIAPVARRNPEARDGGSSQFASPQTRPGAGPSSLVAAQPTLGGATPARQPSPIGAPPPPEALPRWPAPPPGSSLVAPAAEARSLNLVAEAPTAAPAFRLSSEVPREVADRIAHFMRTGSLDRAPFSFGQVAPVAEQAERAPTPEEVADQAVASLLAGAAPHMRLPTGKGSNKDAAGSSVNGAPANGDIKTGKLGGQLTQEVPLPGHLAAQAAIQAQAGLQPPMLVPPVLARQSRLSHEPPRSSGPAPVVLPAHLDRSNQARDGQVLNGQVLNGQVLNGQVRNSQIQSGDVNPLFAPAPLAPASFGAEHEDDYDDDLVIDLIAGPRRDARRDRIA